MLSSETNLPIVKYFANYRPQHVLIQHVTTVLNHLAN